MTTRIDWPPILDRAAEIVRLYDTSVTLRQLFYRLVSEQLLPNTLTSYKRLSSTTAELRRAGEFPDLIDRGRSIHRPLYFDSAEDALADTLRCYRLDRTAGQDVSLYVGVEKAGLVIQLQSWFGDLGVPILALGGYTSQSHVAVVAEDVRSQRLAPDPRPIADRPDGWWQSVPSHRPAVLLYAGDFDPSGEDIDRDFVARTGCWSKVIRIALSAEQVREHHPAPDRGSSPGRPRPDMRPRSALTTCECRSTVVRFNRH